MSAASVALSVLFFHRGGSLEECSRAVAKMLNRKDISWPAIKKFRAGLAHQTHKKAVQAARRTRWILTAEAVAEWSVWIEPPAPDSSAAVARPLPDSNLIGQRHYDLLWRHAEKQCIGLIAAGVEEQKAAMLAAERIPEFETNAPAQGEWSQRAINIDQAAHAKTEDDIDRLAKQIASDSWPDVEPRFNEAGNDARATAEQAASEIVEAMDDPTGPRRRRSRLVDKIAASLLAKAELKIPLNRL